MIGRFGKLVSAHPAMLKIFSSLEVVAQTNSAVLILGESGTGKELLARAIHEKSKRAGSRFHAVNCSVGSRELIDSELFGHVRGAFTGATSDRKGLFEAADGGTLFLDEIGDMPIETQAKILRALETKEIQPVGSSRILKVDVRIISATNQNLTEKIAAGTFREDLFFRINDFQVEIPPLRERPMDIHLLFKDMIEEFNREFGKNIQTLTIAALGILQTHTWPGNVRELRNVIRRAIMFIDRERTELLAEDLFGNIFTNYSSAASYRKAAISPDSNYSGVGPELSLEEYLALCEKDYIKMILKKTGYNKSRAARILGIDRTTLYEKLKKYSLLPARENS